MWGGFSYSNRPLFAWAQPLRRRCPWMGHPPARLTNSAQPPAPGDPSRASLLSHPRPRAGLSGRTGCPSWLADSSLRSLWRDAFPRRARLTGDPRPGASQRTHCPRGEVPRPRRRQRPSLGPSPCRVRGAEPGLRHQAFDRHLLLNAVFSLQPPLSCPSQAVSRACRQCQLLGLPPPRLKNISTSSQIPPRLKHTEPGFRLLMRKTFKARRCLVASVISESKHALISEEGSDVQTFKSCKECCDSGFMPSPDAQFRALGQAAPGKTRFRVPAHPGGGNHIYPDGNIVRRMSDGKACRFKGKGRQEVGCFQSP